MPIFVVMDNNIVSNRIVADTLELAEEMTNATCLEVPKSKEINNGWFYDGTDFISPEGMRSRNA
jgi:hypothetical protein